MIWYFAYGSNMDAARLVERLATEKLALALRVAGRLDGWQLAFDKVARAPRGAGAGNIVAAAGRVVHGTLNGMPAQGLAVLDRYEGVAEGHYARHRVPIVRGDTGEIVESVTYVARRTAPGVRPTRAYLAHLLAGRDLLPADYWAGLAATPTLD